MVFVLINVYVWSHIYWLTANIFMEKFQYWWNNMSRSTHTDTCAHVDLNPVGFFLDYPLMSLELWAVPLKFKKVLVLICWLARYLQKTSTVVLVGKIVHWQKSPLRHIVLDVCLEFVNQKILGDRYVKYNVWWMKHLFCEPYLA